MPRGGIALKEDKMAKSERRITAILCLDDDGGIAFNKRRQSRDRLLIDEICKSYDNIYIDEYSLPLFAGHESSVTVCGEPLAECADGGVCFIERTCPQEWLDEISRLVIYRWNRRYPADISFSLSDACGFKLNERREFVGSSHEKITKEVYVKA